MHKMRFMLTGRLLSILAMTLFILPINVITAFTQDKATTKIQHRPLEYYVSGNRIQIEAKVEDAAGVRVVRCYFRASGQTYYFFVPMQEKEKGLYQGVLPAPVSETESIEYRFLVVSGQNRVVKSQVIMVNRKEQKEVPSWQMASPDGQMQISTDIDQVLIAPNGFEENVVIDITEASRRFGIVTGLYGPQQVAMAGGLTGQAAVAVNSEDIKTDTGGISLWWLAGGLAAIGGLGAAAGGGGGGSGSAITSVTTTIPPTNTTTVSSTTTIPPTPTSRFVNNGNGTVTDTQTGLMWADRDNGSNITWPNARSYCEGYNRGGVSGWRMPTTDELQNLYFAGAFGREIGMTGSNVWAVVGTTYMGCGNYFMPAFMFSQGIPYCTNPDAPLVRALPVRSGK